MALDDAAAYGGPLRKTRPGEWACVGVELEENERADAAGPAMATWTWGLLYSRKRALDGFVPAAALKRSWVGEKQARKDAATLVRVGLFAAATHPELGDGWQLLRYAEWNDTREELEQRRASWAGKKRSQRHIPPTEALTNPEMSPETTMGTPRGTPLNSSLLDSDLFDPRKPVGDHLARAQGQAAPGAPWPGPGSRPPPPPSAEAGPGGPRAAPDGPTPHPGPAERATRRPGPADAGAPAAPEPPPSGARPSEPPACEPWAPTDAQAAARDQLARQPRPFHVRRFEQPFYSQAFADGAAAATGVPCPVARDELAALDDAIDAFAPPSAPGEIRDEWVRASAEAFRVAVRGREQYHRNGGPRGWLDWLRLGSPSGAWLAMTPAQREAHAEEERARERRASRAAAARARRAAEPPPEAPISPEEAAASLARLFGARPSTAEGRESPQEEAHAEARKVS